MRIFSLLLSVLFIPSTYAQPSNPLEGKATYRQVYQQRGLATDPLTIKHFSSQTLHFKSDTTALRTHLTTITTNRKTGQSRTVVMESCAIGLRDSISRVTWVSSETVNLGAKFTQAKLAPPTEQLTLVGEEKIREYRCQVFTLPINYSPKKGPAVKGVQTFYCLVGVPNYHTEFSMLPNLPVRIEFKPESEHRAWTIELTSLEFIPVDPAHFQLPDIPSGYRIVPSEVILQNLGFK
ncbi:MAG: hypothetical protein MUC97_04870 [Bernardetiaceae bacterium]|jgi:hypothetical protein|nr:hypothetical protein [Bernardetiaceae bacterium]